MLDSLLTIIGIILTYYQPKIKQKPQDVSENEELLQDFQRSWLLILAQIARQNQWNAVAENPLKNEKRNRKLVLMRWGYKKWRNFVQKPLL